MKLLFPNGILLKLPGYYYQYWRRRLHDWALNTILYIFFSRSLFELSFHLLIFCSQIQRAYFQRLFHLQKTDKSFPYSLRIQNSWPIKPYIKKQLHRFLAYFQSLVDFIATNKVTSCQYLRFESQVFVQIVFRWKAKITAVVGISDILLPKKTNSKFLVSPQRNRLNNGEINRSLEWRGKDFWGINLRVLRKHFNC